MVNLDVARAMSGHAFAETYGHLDDAVTWHLVGGRTLVGRDAVVAECEATKRYLDEVATTFLATDSVVAGDVVVIESEAEYVDAEGVRSVVASCDVYRFGGGALRAITSYNVEVER